MELKKKKFLLIAIVVLILGTIIVWLFSMMPNSKVTQLTSDTINPDVTGSILYELTKGDNLIYTVQENGIQRLITQGYTSRIVGQVPNDNTFSTDTRSLLTLVELPGDYANFVSREPGTIRSNDTVISKLFRTDTTEKNSRALYRLSKSEIQVLAATPARLKQLVNNGYTNDGIMGNVIADGSNSLVWNTVLSGDGSSTFIPQSVESDSVIESVEIVISNLNTSGFWSDVCLYAEMTPKSDFPGQSFKIAGYSELFCTHSAQVTNKDNQIVWRYNFKDAPLLVKKNTDLACATVTKALTGKVDPGFFHCKINLSKLNPSQPAYRMLRIPYADQQLNSSMNIPATPYTSTSQHPLKIKSMTYFTSFFADTKKKDSTPCIIWKDKAGRQKGRKCFPTQSYDPNNAKRDYITDEKLLEVNWTLAEGDIVKGDCQSTANTIDCAIFLVAEVPSQLINDPYVTFKNYGNVNTTDLNNYCDKNIQNLSKHYFYCKGEASCSLETQVEQCKKIFTE